MSPAEVISWHRSLRRTLVLFILCAATFTESPICVKKSTLVLCNEVASRSTP